MILQNDSTIVSFYKRYLLTNGLFFFLSFFLFFFFILTQISSFINMSPAV